QQLLLLDFTTLPLDSLDVYLGYEDKRIRKKAQFQLVEAGEAGKNILIKASTADNARLKRVHALWGLGQLYRMDATIDQHIIPYLKDNDEEIITQAIKMLGDPKKPVATQEIITLLNHPSSRVVFHAVEALGRMKVKEAFEPLIEVAQKVSDKDLYIRHALVHSLAQIGETTKLSNLATSSDDGVKMVALLALRRLKSEDVAKFLKDKNIDIVAEAARAINDDGGIKAAMPFLAQLLKSPETVNEVIMRRAINAAVRLGDSERLKDLISYSLAKETPVEMRKEALSALSSWHNPSVLDRVDGRYHGPDVRDSAEVRSLVKANMTKYFEFKDGKELAASAQLMVSQDIKESMATVLNLFNQSKDDDLKSELLKSLKLMKNENINDLIKSSLSSNSSKLRATAIGLIDDSMVSEAQLAEMVELTFKNGSSGEQQQLLRLMTKLKQTTIEPSVKNLIASFNKGALPHEVELEFFTLLDSLKNDQIKNALDNSKKTDLVENYKNALHGGNARRGYGTFFWNSTAMCVRCHVVNGEGSNVGPDLSKIGSVLSREQILEAMVNPDARIAPGYGTAIVTLNDDVTHTGVLISENEKTLTLRTSEAEPLVLATNRIKSKEMLPSSMPNAAKKISLGEIRDLVEYLTTLK
ncbi:MAG TPA: HEAT repeat domain-containing protein, partial [Saprospiraceae bacterium]|nr:HEAT repeat domain-containing protein [Saprospiraceae bacterium]